MQEDFSRYLMVSRDTGRVDNVTVGKVASETHDAVRQTDDLETVGLGYIRQPDGSYVRPTILDLPVDFTPTQIEVQQQQIADLAARLAGLTSGSTL